MNKIYALVCPVDGQVKYVGKTNSSLQDRLRQHCEKAKVYDHLLGGKHEWLNALVLLEVLPHIVLIENCGDNWQDREKYWIEFYSKISPLFNQTEGGEDNVFEEGHIPWNKGGGKWQESSLQKMRDAKVGFVFTEEHRQKLRDKKVGFTPIRSAIEKSAEMRLKKVLQYSEDGNFEKEFNSVTEAAESVNGQTNAVSGACNGKYKSVYNKMFRYHTENYPLIIPPNITVKNRKIEHTNECNQTKVWNTETECATWMRENYNIRGDLHSTIVIIRTSCKTGKSYRDNYFKFYNQQK